MSIRDSINTSIKNIANDIASMIQSRANNTLSNLTDEGVEYIKELAEIKAGEYANQELSNLTATGLSQYNVFCVNTGEVDTNGAPAFLSLTDNVLTTSGSFDVTTANGTIYTISDTLEYTADNLEDGTYKIFIDPVNKSISLTQNEITYGSAFPSTAVSGDYLLNTSKVPYDFQKITITTDTDEEGTETTTSTVTKGLNEVYAGTLTISSGEGNLTLNCYNKNIILTNALTGKADVDLSNLTDTGTSTAAGYAMPSSTYTDLTLGSSGSTYTAPADGYFCVVKYNGSSTNANYISLTNNTAGSLQIECRSTAVSSASGRVFVPAHKGDTVTCGYNMVGSTVSFRFIYAVGSV
ncbi:MAG: hypothetical protein LUG16_06995 [Candidatus Gastranaerophilales bacterium]|nr:hypothetical protein [Candidatus Gastranaerophilales bacterium]